MVSPDWRQAVKDALAAKNLSITRVAHGMGVQHQYMSRVLSDTPTIPVATYKYLCAQAGISETEYLTQNEEAKIE